MSLHYLLDGYNIIKQMPMFVTKPFVDARNTLMSLIEQTRPEGSRNNQITIVFDGKPGREGCRPSATVKVIFTEEISADEKIKRIVEFSNHKKQIVVVSDDKEIKFYVRSWGAKVLNVKDFLARMAPSMKESMATSQKKEKEDTKQISKTLEYQITSELEQIWLAKHSKKKT